MKHISIGQMLLKLREPDVRLPRWQADEIRICAEQSKQGADTGLPSDKQVEFVESTFREIFQ